MQSKELTTETDSTSAADGEDQQELHRPDVEPGRVNNSRTSQSGEQRIEAGMSMSGFSLTMRELFIVVIFGLITGDSNIAY